MGMSSWERVALLALIVVIVTTAVFLVGTERLRLRRLALATAALTFGLVTFGAYVRLSDAGLGCPDWPGCYGRFTPAQSAAVIGAEQARVPQGPVSLPKAWKEMLHRYVALVDGCLIVTLLIAALRLRQRFETAPWIAAAVLAVVILQALLGALTVTLALTPAIVTLHLLGGLTTLWLLIWYAQRIAVPAARNQRVARLKPLALAAAAALLVQVALGGWVSANYAGAACADLPWCQQQLLPPTDFGAGFNPLRALGRTAGGDYLPLAALTAIHLAHRGFALVALAALAALAWRCWRAPGMRGLGAGLAALLAVQVALGLAIVASMSARLLDLGQQLPVAAAHNAGAAALVATLAVINFRASTAGRSS